MEKKRLITRSDFDGLVCAMLLRELDMIDEIKFVHPKDVQDGKVDINENDITTNLPFDPRVGLAFDHYGCKNRPWPFPRFQDLQLSAHDGTHRLLRSSHH